MQRVWLQLKCSFVFHSINGNPYAKSPLCGRGRAHTLSTSCLGERTQCTLPSVCTADAAPHMSWRITPLHSLCMKDCHARRPGDTPDTRVRLARPLKTKQTVFIKGESRGMEHKSFCNNTEHGSAGNAARIASGRRRQTQGAPVCTHDHRCPTHLITLCSC